MDALWKILSDYTFQTVALGSALLGIISGVIGSFTVLRRQSLLGDGISHAALPGVAAAFLLTGSKNTEILLGGALLTGITTICLISVVTNYSRIKFDSALALTMSVFFGAGLVLLTYAQKIPNANQAGLSRFIYGQASTLLQRDVLLMAFCGAAMLTVVVLFWKEFKLCIFDPDFAKSIGFSVGRINMALSLLAALAIIIGLQTVGVVLMSAMLIAPAVAARQWTSRLWLMLVLAGIFGAASGVCGTLLSSAAAEIPTGPVIALCASGIAVFSLLFAPGRGILHRFYLRRKAQVNAAAERRNEV